MRFNRRDKGRVHYRLIDKRKCKRHGGVGRPARGLSKKSFLESQPEAREVGRQ